MHPSLRNLSARVHKPLINFLGKRKWPAQPETPHAHPAAPPEFKKSFSDFLKKFDASSSQSSTPSTSSASSKDTGAYQDFWEAPARVWMPRVRNISDIEMEAILSGGASLRG